MMLMDLIKARHSIRKYTEQQIDRKNLELILEAGNFAPNAEDYSCQGFVILGYIDGEQPHSKPRKPGRIKIIE